MRLKEAIGEAVLFLVAMLLTRVAMALTEKQEGAQRVLDRKPVRPKPSSPPQRSRRLADANHVRKAFGRKANAGIQPDRPPTALPGVVEHTCPYAIDSEEEAIRRIKDESIPGNVVKVENLQFCRTGNHFISFFRNLALGYCCKSKVVWLPPKDDVLSPGIFNEGTPGPRWFDFSSAPDVPGFNSSSCATDITWAGPRAFHMHQLAAQDHEFYNPEILQCALRAPRLLGCEAAYYFPKDVDLCPVNASPAGAGEKGRGGGEGNLVVHVRSGDIFSDKVLPYYGQPPLQFYLRVIQHSQWDRVDVVTNGQEEGSLNPVVPVLQALVEAGELPDSVHVHTNRSIEEDLLSMICADGLALARSTLSALTALHSKAKLIYAPHKCNDQLQRIALQRPEVQAYSIVWAGHYSVYESWENNSDQRAEMLAYDKIRGFKKCMGK